MGRPVILSNSHILVGLDEHASVHDFYFPYVGLDNLASSRNLNHKIGVWVEGQFSWLDDGSWDINMDFEDQALISQIRAEHKKLKVRLDFQDFVDTHHPVLARLINVTNLGDQRREVRVFTHQAFQISRAGRSDTALFVPDGHYILDYKGWSSLLVYAEDQEGRPFDQFAVGNCGIEGKEGTFKDAEDGELSGSLVEHGGVDSVMRTAVSLDPNQSKTINYWVVAADSQADAEKFHKLFLKGGANERLQATRQTWKDWLAISGNRLDQIDERYKELATKSLMIVKAHIDRHGGIIASADSSIYNYGRDYYSYVWPRDGAYAIMPLIELGYKEEPKRFFQFCADTMNPDGYMMHKYQPDRALGSTWHPLLHLNHPELPIQEDETAIVIYSLYKYLQASNDEDFVRNMYGRFIQPCADFMAEFIDEQTSLPHASYDLWEQKFATFTYTVFVTLMALDAAAKIAERFNKFDDRERWQGAKDRIESGLKSLVGSGGTYIKSLLLQPHDEIKTDATVDVATFFGAFQYGQADVEKLAATVKAVEDTLLAPTPIGGVPRYEHDDYFLDNKSRLGNPWMITTLWLAQYYISNQRRDDALKLIDWVQERVGDSGMLAEQANPDTGIGVGVCPLVWSHSTFLETVLMLAKN